MGFDANAIAVVTRGLRRSTGSFSERLVSYGLIGDIVGSSSVLYGVFSWLRRFKGFIA